VPSLTAPDTAAHPLPGATQPLPGPTSVGDGAPHPLSTTPPLGLVAALSGLFATLLVRVVIPSRDPDSAVVAWQIAARIGDFAVNLCAVASMVALVGGLLPWLRGGSPITTRRRLLIASFGGMLLPVWVRAVFFGREAMNGALAGIGSATACSLSALLVISAIVGARARPMQLLPVALITLSTLCSLTLLTLQSIAIVAPFSQVHRVTWLISDMGEAAYLGVMLCALTLVPRAPWTLRKLAGAALGGVALLSVGIGFWLASVALGRDFAVALYYAQHVTWFLDGALWIYALPLAIGFGGCVAAVVSGDALQRQLAVAVLAWIGAGFAPRAPWRFMLLAMSACLVARAITAYRDQAPSIDAPAAAPIKAATEASSETS
jgi:uncharacterized membrane protein (UPF0136 family)